MTGTARVVWDDALRAYDFGPGHPLAPIRVELAMLLARHLGLLDPPGLMIRPADVPDALLASVHDPGYIAALRAADARTIDAEHGIGTPDNPAFDGMHDAAVRVAGATLAAAQAVWSGEALHAVNLAGGLHHAMADHASGFCLYNDLAVAIRWALDSGAERVAYLDVDVHHGDGVQAIFADDPRVLTVSLHESGRTLFPGTGNATETGSGAAEGTAVNIALPAGTDDNGWLRAFDAVVPAVVADFSPQLIISQHGVDSHLLDPLAHLALSVDGQRAAMTRVHDLAHAHADGRWVAAGGGGYEWVDVVPRSWAHLIGIVTGRPVDPATALPEEWRAYVTSRLGRQAPGRMTDGATPAPRDFEAGFDPDDPVDAAILATRHAVFPLHGLDPIFG